MDNEVYREAKNETDLPWDDYSTKFNLLSDKMIEHGIDLKILYDVLKARDKRYQKSKGA